MPSKRYVVQEVPPPSGLQKSSGGGENTSVRSMDRKNQAGIGRRLGLLLWKNLLLRRRHWIVTLLEILLPTLAAIALAFFRTQITDDNKTIMNTTTIFPPQDEMEMLSESRRTLFRKKSFLAYVPVNNLTTKIMEDMSTILKARRMELKGFDTEEELVEFNEQSELESAKEFVQRVRAAIVFGKPFHSGLVEDLKNYPDGKLDYVIRLPIYTIETRSSFPWIQFAGPSDDNAFSYVNGGFTGLQIILDKLLIGLVSGKEVEHEIYHQVFPYPPYVRSKGFDQLNSLAVPLFMIIGFVFIVPSIIIKVVSERETGIKELMKIMGLPNWIHWLGWMLNSLLVLVISVTLVIFFFFTTFNQETGPVLPYSDPTVWWVVLFFYIVAATSYCFFISVLSDRATTATAIGIVTWLVFYLGLAFPMEQNLESLTLTHKLLSCLFPNMALHWAVKAMYSFETRGVGANWQTTFQPTSPIDGFALYHVLIMFILDTIIFVALTIYFENVLPSKYGLRKPWYYIFLKSTYISDDTPIAIQTRRQSLALPIERQGFEKEPVGLPVGVAIQNLKKTFGKKKAVDGVSMKMFEGQITAVLGHNGAGKTTTLSILTGLYPPSGGTASVNGFDIRSEMDEVRTMTGLCPQHNMLFDRLTVWEHLILFGRLKGLSHDDAAKEARTLIKKLHLKEKTNYMSCELSGGQKRKLSLGMALIGGSKVVILDECTSGMDPEARRVIWDLLLEMRGERTIILTTHFMEEADVLGDRIVMMASGKIKCCGTPLFLKKYYGTGYTLKLTTTNGGGESTGNKDILDVVQTLIPRATMESSTNDGSNGHTNGHNNGHNGHNGQNNGHNNQSEMSMSLPNDEKTLEIFPDLFSKLNADKESLGIVTIGLSLSTIDQVFLKIGEIEARENNELLGITSGDEGDGKKDKKSKSKDDGMKNGINMNGMGGEPRRPRRRLIHQLFGLFQKKFNFTVRNRKLLISQFVIPPVLLIAAILLSTVAYSPATSSPKLKMNISQFKTAVTYYSSADKETGDIYANLVGTDAQPRSINPNQTSLIDALIKVADDDLGAYRDQYMIAAYFNASTASALYNSIPYHAAPISMNLVTNTILKRMSPRDKNYSLDIAYHPLENQLFATLQAAQPNPAFTLLVPVVFGALVPIGLALFAASYSVFPTEERLSNSKQLQLMTGVNTVTFWGTSFVWDFFIMAVAILIMAISFPLFESHESFTAHDGLGSIILILLIYGYSAISFSYLFSLFAPSSAFAFAWVTIIHVLFGMMIPIIIFFADNANFTQALLPVRWFCRSFSSFGGSMSIMRYAAIATSNSRCSILTSKELDIICNPKYQVDGQLRQCCPNCLEFASELTPDIPACFEPEKFFTWNYTYVSATDAKKYTIPGIGQEVLYVMIVALIYQILIVLIESGAIQRVRAKIGGFFEAGTSRSLTAMEQAEGYKVDEDVAAENERVHKMTKSDDALVVCDLSKNFGSFAAVREINFGVHYGECFGLLGVNGAGKTTTFRMLTGDEGLTSGNAFSFMNTLRTNKKDFFASIGYCPQFDAIVGSLSGREMLTLFCHLRGVPFSETRNEVDKWLCKLGLEKSGDVPSESYSGGMKRRLSVGIAMIGDPPVVLLDEPTSGVDPASRRQFWDVISSAKASGQSVILTSHSMDEIEVLCARLGIMVNGRFQCLGSAEYLRNKFAHGYTLVVRLKHHHHIDSPIISHMKTEILSRFEPCELQDEHQNILQFQLLDSTIPWSEIFRNMEEIKKMNVPAVPEVISETMRRQSLKIVPGEDGANYGSLIEDYTVSLTSLEEVFLSFARKQYSGRSADSSCLGLGLVCKGCNTL